MCSSDLTRMLFAAIINEAITPPTLRSWGIPLNYNPVPNCYLHIADGASQSTPQGAANARAAGLPFVTVIFGITADPSYKGPVEDISATQTQPAQLGAAGQCNCAANASTVTSSSATSASSQTTASRMMRRADLW